MRDCGFKALFRSRFLRIVRLWGFLRPMNGVIVSGILQISVVPDGLIPQPILKFVAANYPGRHVRGVERDGRNHEITLDNGLELKFNRRFRLVETDH